MSLRENWARLSGPARFTGLDLARGLAVIGMLGAHLLWTEPFSWADVGTWTDLFNGRSSILFATLAGVSIAILTGGAAPYTGRRADRAVGRLAIRALLLWALGILLLLLPVPVYVILPAYGILFLLALPFTRMRPPILFATAAVLGLIMPWLQILVLDTPPFWQTEPGEAVAGLIGWAYPFPVWIAFVLCGMGVGRLRLDRVPVQTALLGVGVLLALVGYGLAAAASGSDEWWSAVWTAEAHSGGVLEVIGSTGFALAVLGASLLVCRTGVRWVVLPVRAVGSMPLTAYTAQLVAWAIAAALLLDQPDDLTAFRDLDPFPWFVLWTVVGCTAWAILFGRGPLEWVMDRVCRILVPAERADRVVR